MNRLKITPDMSGQRLDSVIQAMDPKFSRSTWRNLIKNGHVQLDGRVNSRPATTVKTNAVIKVKLPRKLPNKPKLPVIYEDNQVMVLDKPAGLLVQPTSQVASEWSIAELIEDQTTDSDPNRAGIVHRLDRGTSGVIIIAKTTKAKKYLQAEFAERHVQKIYQAIIEGKPNNSDFSVDLPIGRDSKYPGRFKVRPDGRTATTRVKVIKCSGEACLVKLWPKTGRTHQLRVHLSTLGHPIIGDILYGRQPIKSAKRLYLHAWQLKLRLPDGQIKQFEAKLPPSFKQGLKRYGLA